MKHSVWVSTVILAWVTGLSGFAGQERGGGDEVGLEFHAAFHSALQELKNKDLATFKQIANAQIELVAKNAKVIVVDEALDVHVKDLIQDSVAANEPHTMTIMINRARWNAIKSPHLKEAIALHEILSLKGLEETGFYPISGRFLNSSFEEGNGV
jgi:hypothetical protein